MTIPRDDTIGGVLIGVMLSMMTYGISTLQVVLYFSDLKNEPVATKLLVLIVMLLETVHTAMSMYSVYAITVLRFNEPELVTHIVWSEPALILTGIVTMAIVHGFFVRRIWCIYRSKILTALTGFFAFAHFILGMMVSLAYRYIDWPHFQSRKSSLVIVVGGLGSAAIADILIAVLLTHYLRQQQVDVNIRFNSALNRLIAYIASSGLITALTSVGTIIAFALDKHFGIFLGMAALQSKVYANSLLANLNLKRNIRARLAHRPPEFTTVVSGVQGLTDSELNEYDAYESPPVSKEPMSHA